MVMEERLLMEILARMGVEAEGEVAKGTGRS